MEEAKVQKWEHNRIASSPAVVMRSQGPWVVMAKVLSEKKQNFFTVHP
jgi:hypothetical protein